MVRFDICNATRQWKDCADTRPWLVVELGKAGRALCFPISGQRYAGQRFELPADHRDFPRTGLSKTCYVYTESLFEIGAASFGRRRGELAGALLEEFQFWSNVR